MKNRGKKSLLLVLLSSLMFLPGCEMLLLPFQFVFFILGSATTLFFRLLPVAAKLLPLALLIVRVPDEELKNNNIENNVQIVYHSEQTNPAAHPDASGLIQSKLKDCTDGKYIVFSFDAATSENEMKAVINKELNGTEPLSVDCYIANGASFYNDKFGFFLLLDRMKKQGVTFKSYDSLKPVVDLFNEEIKS